jgi:membrane protease YdiL (CAAX protease family)
VQVLVTAIAGYFFYVSRRVSGGLLVAAVLHGLWDFGAISGGVVADEQYLGTFAFILGDIVLALVLLARRRKIELQPRLTGVERTT